MANTKHRIHRVVALTAFAAAALLVGPHATLGLDTGVVSGTVNQTTATTQAVVETTQQTLDSTVTTVETTTQAVEQTVEQAPAPVPAAAPVATAAPAPTAPSPNQTSTPTRQPDARTTAPSAALRVADRARGLGRDSSTKLASATEAVRSGAGRAADRAGAGSLARTRSTSSRQSTGARSSDEPATCLPAGVPELLAALQLRSILSVLCATVELPGRTAPTTPAGAVGGSGSDAGTSTVKTLGQVLGVVAAVAAPTNPLALFAPDEIRLPGKTSSGRAGVAAGNASGASVAPGTSGRAGASTAAIAQEARQTGAGDAYGSGVATDTHTPVQGSSDGSRKTVSATSALATILAIDLALLTLLLGYRAARRWVIPRLV